VLWKGLAYRDIADFCIRIDCILIYKVGWHTRKLFLTPIDYICKLRREEPEKYSV
jgi:mRNA-degrading endonuclease YafQ of YafQ-DinJ toxin-antitoxin module